jgi:outer membrane receptor protein involved in Fe transport
MTALNRLLVATCAIGCVAVCSRPAAAQAVSASRTQAASVPAPTQAGRIEGQVTDEHGAPVAGAAIVAHGARLLVAMSDRDGRFVVENVKPGPYQVRAQHARFAASRRETVEVAARASTWQSLEVRRLPGSKSDETGPAVLAASTGFAPGGGLTSVPLASGESAAEAAEPEETHDHSATAWRLRHVKRSVLRDVTPGEAVFVPEDVPDGDEVLPRMTSTGFGGGGSIDTSLWFDSVSGEVQLLTTGSFHTPEQLFSSSSVPRGVAYVAIGSPVGSRTTWTVQGAVTQGDLSSWVVGGTFATPSLFDHHDIDVELSYGTQRYDGGNLLALAAVADGTRNVGALSVFDHWRLAPRLSVTYGARYAKYDYIEGHGLFSPAVGLRWSLSDGVWLRASVSQQMLAPGAEEFVPSPVAGQWLPPQRTFSPYPGSTFAAERARHFEVVLERQLSSWVVSARGYRQDVSDQLVTMFGEQVPGGPRGDIGHYHTANAGDLAAFGWGLGVSRPVASRLRGSVEYSVTQAGWAADSEVAVIASRTTLPVRSRTERLHDITTVIETEIPETATRVYAAYKLNSGYASSLPSEDAPAFDGRFDVQVSQRLPFMEFTTTKWEVLFAVRNLFREQLTGASVYDELLVLRPPKRIVGGLMVRF